MWFLHPGILVASAGVALLPLVIHLINRRRYRREPWAATMFLLRAHRRSQRQIQLDQWLLLALRTLTLLILGVAIARPYLSADGSGWIAERQPVDRVLLLDDSLSMRARRDDGSRSFDAARLAAERILSQADPGDGVALVTVATPARTLIERPMHDAAAARVVLDGVHCTYQRADWTGALRQAREAAARGSAQVSRRIAYVLTDLAAGDMPASEAVAPGPDFDQVVVINVGPVERGNLSIRDLRFDSPVVGPGVPTRVRCRVTNHGASPKEGASIEIQVDGRRAAVVSIPALGPGQTTDARSEVTFAKAGPHMVSAMLTKSGVDVLDEDNTARLAVRVPDRLAVLLVEQGSARAAAEGSLFFFRVALMSRNAAGGPETLTTRTVSPLDLDSEILSDYRVVVIGDAPRLPGRTLARLKRFVQDGGGLIVSLGEHATPEAYATLFSDNNKPAGSDDEPSTRSTSAPNSVMFGELVRWDGSGESPRFQVPDGRHPLVSDFEGREDGGLASAMVRSRWTLTDPLAAQLSSPETPLLFSDGRPALIACPVGWGRVLIVLTGLSMAETTLPAKPDFVPFAINLAAYAAGDAGGRLNVKTGDALVAPVATQAEAEISTIILPDGTTHSAVLEPLGDSLSVVFRDTPAPGPYRIQQGPGTSLFAVNVIDGDSDLKALDERALRAAFGSRAILAGDDGPELRSGSESGPRELAGFALYLLVLLVVVETWAASSAGRAA